MENGNKFKQFIKNNFIYFIIGFTCIAYITYGLVKIETSGRSILEFIGSGIVIFVLAYLISLLFSFQGMLTGDRKDEVVKTNTLHAKCVADIDPRINEMDAWCEEQNTKALMTVRKQILNKEGIRYIDCFDDDGTAKDVVFELKIMDDSARALKKSNPSKYKIEKQKIREYNKQQKARTRAFKKAIKAKITPLSTDAITAITVKHNDPNNLGMDRHRYQKKVARSSLFSKVTISIAFSYFTFSFVMGWENLIAALIQVAIFLLMGSIKFVQSYYFVTEDLRKRTVRQINYLQRFKCDKGIATKQEVTEECKILKNGESITENIEENTHKTKTQEEKTLVENGGKIDE